MRVTPCMSLTMTGRSVRMRMTSPIQISPTARRAGRAWAAPAELVQALQGPGERQCEAHEEHGAQSADIALDPAGRRKRRLHAPCGVAAQVEDANQLVGGAASAGRRHQRGVHDQQGDERRERLAGQRDGPVEALQVDEAHERARGGGHEPVCRGARRRPGGPARHTTTPAWRATSSPRPSVPQSARAVRPSAGRRRRLARHARRGRGDAASPAGMNGVGRRGPALRPAAAGPRSARARATGPAR